MKNILLFPILHAISQLKLVNHCLKGKILDFGYSNMYNSPSKELILLRLLTPENGWSILFYNLK